MRFEPCIPGADPSPYDQEVARLNAAVAAADTVTVEVGTGDLPLFSLKGTTVYDRHNLYVGVNRDPRQHCYLAERIGAVAGFAVLSGPEVPGGPERVPLPDGVADVVVMANVLGEPNSSYIMRPFMNEAGIYRGSTSHEAKVETLRSEISRLLKSDGRLVILETTPTLYGGGRLFESAWKLTTSLLRQCGFEVEAAGNVLSPDVRPVVERYAAWHRSWNRASYIVVARKADPETSGPGATA